MQFELRKKKPTKNKTKQKTKNKKQNNNDYFGLTISSINEHLNLSKIRNKIY